MPVSQSAEIRAQVVSGLALATQARAAVAEYYWKDVPAVPADRTVVGLGPISGPYVQSVEIVNGRVDILYSNGANAQIAGQVLSLTLYERTGSLEWRCGRGAEPSLPAVLVSDPDATTVADSYLPDQCRP